MNSNPLIYILSFRTYSRVFVTLSGRHLKEAEYLLLELFHHDIVKFLFVRSGAIRNNAIEWLQPHV